MSSVGGQGSGVRGEPQHLRRCVRDGVRAELRRAGEVVSAQEVTPAAYGRVESPPPCVSGAGGQRSDAGPGVVETARTASRAVRVLALARPTALTAHLLWLGTSLTGCGSSEADLAGAEIATELKSRAPMDDELERLRPGIQARLADYRGSLSLRERAEDEWNARQIGGWNGELKVGWTARGALRHLWAWRMRIPTDAGPQSTPLDAVGAFLKRSGSLFGISNAVTALEATQVQRTADGAATIIRMRQVANGLPVFGANLLLAVGPEGDIVRLGGHLVPDAAIPTDAASSPRGESAPAELGYWDPEIAGAPPGRVRLAWRERRTGTEDVDVFLDAHNGAELARAPLDDHDEHKEIFDCSSCTLYTQLPGAIHYDDQCHSSGVNACPSGSGCSPSAPCQTNSPPASVAALKNYANDVHDYYLTRHGRDSWDNNLCAPGNPKCPDPSLHRMRASIAGQGGNFGSPCNARFTTSGMQTWYQASNSGPALDTVGHEFTHAVDYIEGDLNGNGPDQARQLNEAVPDVFGELIQHNAMGSTDWVHNTGTTGCWRNTNYVNTALGGPTCNLLNPVTPPDNWAFYHPVASPSPCANVNYSAAIMGKIGYLMGRDPAAGAVTHWGVPVTGIGPIATGNVWYRALTEYTWSTQTFTEFSYALIDACATYTSGQDFVECYKAIAAVGVWSAETPQGWAADAEPALLYYPTQPDQRWVFYKEPASTNLYFRTRTCPTYDSGCSWSSPTLVNAAATSAPRATDYDDYFAWVCYRDTSGSVACDRINVFGAVVAAPDPAGATLDGPPSLVRNGGALYLAYARSGNIYWRTYTTASGWGPELGPIVTGAGSGPTLASAAEDRYGPGADLWLAYRTATGRIAYRLYSPSTSTWGAERLLGRPPETPTVDGQPSVIVYRGRLHVAGRTGTAIYYAGCSMPCSANSNDWTRWVKQDGTSGFSPSLESYGAADGYMYLWHSSSTSNTLQWRARFSE